MCLFRWYTLKKGKGAEHGGESDPLLAGLCRQVEHLLVMGKLFFLRVARGSETRTGWGGTGHRCPPILGQLSAACPGTPVSKKRDISDLILKSSPGIYKALFWERPGSQQGFLEWNVLFLLAGGKAWGSLLSLAELQKLQLISVLPAWYCSKAPRIQAQFSWQLCRWCKGRNCAVLGVLLWQHWETGAVFICCQL